MDHNMRFYEKLKNVPQSMISEITAGPLGGKGFTAVNPMWRIRRMSEVFGPCGFGWWYTVKNERIETGGNTAMVFIDIELFVKDPETGEVSMPIAGTGGNKFYSRKGISDECFKMALTDALGVAMKNLGMGADIYEKKERSKYDPEGEMSFGTNEPAHKKKAPKGEGKSGKEVKEPLKVLQAAKEEIPPKEDNTLQSQVPSNAEEHDETLKGKETEKEINKAENTAVEEALKVVINFGPERGKTMKEAQENERFWNFIGSMDTAGDPGREQCRKAYDLIMGRSNS